MLGQQTPAEGSLESLITVTDDAQNALVAALGQDSEPPHSLRLQFQGFG